MTDIPADILAVADTVVACVNVDTSDRNQQIKYVALAIIMERERCADIAEKYRKKNESRNGFGSQPAYSTAWNIKAEILKPKIKRKPKAETSREASPAVEMESVQSGADVVSVCPALIDDVGGDA